MPFEFDPGGSFLHRIDVRFKLCALLALSMAAAAADWPGLLLSFAIALAALARTGLPLAAAGSRLRGFLLLVLMVAAARWATWEAAPFSLAGLADGLVLGLRLLLVALLGLLLVRSTRPEELKKAVTWLLTPFPRAARNRVPLMMGLVLRFIPLVAAQAAMTGDALRARGIEQTKNPFRRLLRFALPLSRRVFARADRLALAMAARGYDPERVSAARFPDAERGDWALLAVAAFLSALMVLA